MQLNKSTKKSIREGKYAEKLHLKNLLSKKGQVAFEFLLIYSFFIFVFLTTLYIISGQAINQQKYAEGMYAREFITSIADEINAAATIPGYEKNLSIPTTIGGVPYQIYVYKGLIELNYSSITNIDLLYPLATNNIFVKNASGKHNTSSTLVLINTSKGYLVLKNEGGTVVINNE